MNEIWLPIPGFEGAYEVSNLGRVRSLDRLIKSGRTTGKNKGWQTTRGRILKTPPNSFGYPHTQLGRGNTRQVHSLVLLAFRGPPPAGANGCHNDGNPANCQLDNLRWDTQANNLRDKVTHGTNTVGEKNGVSKLTEAQLVAIHADRRSRRDIAAAYGISEHHVSGIRRRRTWKHLPLAPIADTSRQGEGNKKAKLTEAQVLAIRADTRVHHRIANDYGVTRDTISRVKRNKSWAHL
jgi:NUMOD4 motif/HNH endonuclease